jgi:hypothetical protein
MISAIPAIATAVFAYARQAPSLITGISGPIVFVFVLLFWRAVALSKTKRQADQRPTSLQQQSAPEARKRPSPNIVCRGNVSTTCELPYGVHDSLTAPCTAIAFRNDVTTSNARADKIVAHLDFYSDAGKRTSVNEGWWCEDVEDNGSFYIAKAETKHLVIVATIEYRRRGVRQAARSTCARHHDRVGYGSTKTTSRHLGSRRADGGRLGGGPGTSANSTHF